MLRDDQAEKLEELLVLGKVHMGSGLNQELGLQRAGDTHWGSHFKTAGNEFSNLIRLGDLSETLVKTNLHMTWRLVYLLVKLSLILHVATTTVKRAFSSMKYVKNDLRSRIGDEFLNDCLVCYIEDEVFESVPNDAIIDHFQDMTSCQVQL
uniref:Zinc finger MYM-type protein 1-like n=1 Tax=Nicotiana tabacum TaxID=4097 RepID=A0A1S4CHJ2_TOBAC|nr:PREDICTED: uncharacterized protein LOC107818902 [Nicotiana tabacum]